VGERESGADKSPIFFLAVGYIMNTDTEHGTSRGSARIDRLESGSSSESKGDGAGMLDYCTIPRCHEELLRNQARNFIS
jgi:hypothetical protein